VVVDCLGKISPPFLLIQKTKNKFSVVIINSNSVRIEKNYFSPCSKWGKGGEKKNEKIFSYVKATEG